MKPNQALWPDDLFLLPFVLAVLYGAAHGMAWRTGGGARATRAGAGATREGQGGGDGVQRGAFRSARGKGGVAGGATAAIHTHARPVGDCAMPVRSLVLDS